MIECALLFRLRSHWRFKAILALALPVFFCVPYFLLQRLTLFPHHTFHPGWIDRHVPFQPGWAWAYQSVYVFMPIMPWLADSGDSLRRYATGFALLSCVGFLIFLFYPVAGPRPHSLAAGGMYGLLVSYDTKLNAFPSLHAALTTYTILFGFELIGPSSRRLQFAYLLLFGPWGFAILYATLATKQHFAADLLAGILLACVAHQLAWRGRGVSERRRLSRELATCDIGRTACVSDPQHEHVRAIDPAARSEFR